MRFSALVCAALSTLLTAVSAHGSHSDAPRPDDWALYHLQEEHHISNFDAGSFFALHDFDNDGYWTSDELYRTYGFADESLKDIAPETKHSAIKQVFAIFDPANTGSISREAWINKVRQGKRLPDFGYGSGHHGDDEYEYEIHHFEKFHGEDAKEEDLIHAEDIEHFRKHDKMEEEQYRVELEQSQSIVEANIPLKFRKQQ